MLRYVEDWNRLTERIGFWIDLDDPYVTMTNDYIESVWWSLRQIWDAGLLYEGHKVVPYCPRCGTALSSHEVAQGYADVEDPSVYVRFPVLEAPPSDEIPEPPVEPGDSLRRLDDHAVDADLQRGARGRRRRSSTCACEPATRSWSLARDLVERVLGEDAEVLAASPARRSPGIRYEPPFDYITDYGPRGHTVLLGDFVTTEDGTGIVHTAIAFGEDDFRLGEQYGITLQNPVRPDGTFDERVTDFAGRFVKDADADIVEALRASGRLLRAEIYEHSYPHCWRCGTPLLYYAKASWYIRTTEVRDRMLAENETIGWRPEHVKHGRFGKLARGQRRLGAVARALLGHPAADLGVRWRRLRGALLRRLGGRAARPRRRGARRPAPPVHRRGRASPARRCGGDDAAGRGGDRRLVRLGRDALRAVSLPVRGGGGVRAAIPGRLHLRGPGPDPRLVLLAARGVGAAVRHRPATATASASA